MRQTAIAICRKLQDAGHEALFAGGVVRDRLLGKESDDIDIATSATPEQIEALFDKSYAIGKHFGVVLIEENNLHFEIATFRSDGGYSDGRRPDAVFFTNKKEDALRRDFTCNALFWDPIAEQIYDYVNGQQDITDGILRFVGDAETRINEDFLRILRAVRFKNTLGFAYGDKLETALQKHASLVGQVAAERVKAELEKMLLDISRIGAISDLERLKILSIVLPEVAALRQIPDAHRDRDVLAHTLDCIEFLPAKNDAILLWALLLHDTGKAETLTRKGDRNHFPQHEIASEKIAKQVTRRLKFSRFETDKIAWLCKQHIPFYQTLQMTRSHRLHFFDHPFFEDLIRLCRCDALADDGNDSLVQQIEAEYHAARESRLLPQFHPDLLDGDAIMQLTRLAAGSKIGELKYTLRQEQIAGNITTVEAAETWLKQQITSEENPSE